MTETLGGLELIESKDVALRLGISRNTVRNLARRGELPFIAVTARGVRLFEAGAIACAATRLREQGHIPDGGHAVQ